METIQQDIFTNDDHALVQAGSGKRFANYLIDLVIFYLLVFLFGIFLGFVNPQTLDELDAQSNGFDLVGRLLSLLFYGLYMFVVEAIFKGKSLGKLITGTRAVNEDGTAISFQTALLRGLSRAVPFNAFSALGTPCYPWHDRWTKTYVIDEKESLVPENNIIP